MFIEYKLVIEVVIGPERKVVGDNVLIHHQGLRNKKSNGRPARYPLDVAPCLGVARALGL